MTNKQAMQKIRQMAKYHNKYLLKECERLLNSGGISVSDAENNFIVPKIVMHVALLNEANQYKPLSTNMRKEVENLKHF